MAFDYSKAVTDAEAKYDIPDGIYERLLGQGERSGATATSPKGAYGYAQLMPAAAHDMGVDRNDPSQNIDGGAHYLKTLYDRFGDWGLAVAHYNAGPSGDINNKETRAYYRRVMGRDMPDAQSTSTSTPAPMPGLDPKMQEQQNQLFQRGIKEAEQGDADYRAFLEQYGKNADKLLKEYDSAVHNPIPEPPKPPNLHEAPNGQDYMHNPVGVLQQTLPLMAVFAGGLTRRHAIGAMKAMAAAMNAQKSNDQQAFEQAHQKWRDDTEQTLQQYTLIRQQYEDIMSNRNASLQDRMGELQAWAVENQISQAKHLISQGDLGRVSDIMQLQNANAYRMWQVQDMTIRQQQQQERLEMDREYKRWQEAGGSDPAKRAYTTAYQAALDAGKSAQEAEHAGEASAAAYNHQKNDETNKLALQWRRGIQADKRTQAYEQEQQFIQALKDVDPAKMDEGPTQKLVIDAFNRLATNQAARKFLIDAGDQGLLNKADMLGKHLLTTKGPVMGKALAKRYYDAAQKMAETMENPYDQALAENARAMEQNGLDPTIAIDQHALDRISSKGYWTPAGGGGQAVNPAAGGGGPAAAKFKLTPDLKSQYDQAVKAGNGAKAKQRLADAGYDVSGLS